MLTFDSLNLIVRTVMKQRLIAFAFLLLPSLSNAVESFAGIDQAVKAIAGERFELKDYQSASETKESPYVPGLVWREDSSQVHWARLFVLRRGRNGRYGIAEVSKEFRAPHGPHHYVEIIQIDGRDRFSIQINHEEQCGIGRDIYRFALVDGSWRVSGLDSTVPDRAECDVNNDSYGSSQNFITGKVSTVFYKQGRKMKSGTKHVSFPARMLMDFDPEAIGGR